MERYVDIFYFIIDIIDGRIYRELLFEGGFFYYNCNIIVLMNIDGLSFYLFLVCFFCYKWIIIFFVFCKGKYYICKYMVRKREIINVIIFGIVVFCF